MTVELPYFDDIFERLARTGESPFTRIFQQHTHWGFFARRDDSEISDASFVAAAEAMTERVCLSARVGNGLRVLDVGCGFGGTLSHLNERLSGCELVGVNIDERQIAQARKRVLARAGNSVRFEVGDACALPFADGAFDVVMAVECIFHFPSRRTFLGEARRVLRPGGRLTVSDFIVNADKFDEMSEWIEANPTAQGSFFGSTTAAISSSSYARLGRTKGMTLVADEDITAETLPTYPCLEGLYRKENLPEAVKTVAFLEELARRGFFEYRILSFEAAT
jgi:ubiquinone/menaquinone biosynthesis C-methylase UbiE